MGNDRSQEKKEIQLHISHPRFASAKIVTVDAKRFLQLTTGVEEKQYESWKLNLLKYKNIPENLLLPRNHSFNRNGLCGNAGTLEIQYDNYPYLLTQQIYNRRGKRSRFTEQELWHLLLCLTKAKLSAREAGQAKVGDIRPRNVFLNEEGDIRVSNLHSWPWEVDNFQKSLEKAPTYLAPQQLKRLQMGSLQDNSNQSAQIFSIGFTLLSAGTLSDFQSLYNLSSFHFNEEEATQIIRSWQTNVNYSEILRSLIANLTAFDSSRRLTLDQLWSLLAKHEENILKKIDFLIDNAPDKLHQEIQFLRNLMVASKPIPQMSAPTTHTTSEYSFEPVKFPSYLGIQQVVPQDWNGNPVQLQKETQQKQSGNE